VHPKEIQWPNHEDDVGITACLENSTIIALSGYLLYSYRGFPSSRTHPINCSVHCKSWTRVYVNIGKLKPVHLTHSLVLTHKCISSHIRTKIAGFPCHISFLICIGLFSIENDRWPNSDVQWIQWQRWHYWIVLDHQGFPETTFCLLPLCCKVPMQKVSELQISIPGFFFIKLYTNLFSNMYKCFVIVHPPLRGKGRRMIVRPVGNG
jgi:hypothetical protein